MPNWDDLRVFLAVARGESLSRAGRDLKMDPATVGRRITRLEQRLGAVLFVKSPQGYALTEAGERLLAPAEQAEGAFSTGIGAVTGLGGRLTGSIRIGAPDGCANFVLPQVCAAIQSENPGLEIQVLALPRVVNLSKREADMAVTVSPPTAGRLTVQKICDYHLHLAAPHETAGRITTLADLQHEAVIGYIPDMIFDKELDYLSELGVSNVGLASNSISVQLNLMRAGGGMGIAHDFAMPFAPELRLVLTDLVALTRGFYLVRHASDRHSERLNRFSTALVAGMRAEIARLERLANA
ncbi:LysR family transcriptional regulator [Nioella nitratireducens]|uniref:LysR family transcriptional regulator n=1 Tax=Nioella nitratireducens TaxID=1287720 RepID=UPI0008FD2BA4|nr:LysR family transcriptional regulator [Nioella nitratireducens]